MSIAAGRGYPQLNCTKVQFRRHLTRILVRGRIAVQCSRPVIDYAHTPHVGVVREDEEAPGGTTRAGIFNWEPPEELPHAVKIAARDAQKLVGAVDVAHILDEQGQVLPEWREQLRAYLRDVSAELMQRHATALILRNSSTCIRFSRSCDMTRPILRSPASSRLTGPSSRWGSETSRSSERWASKHRAFQEAGGRRKETGRVALFLLPPIS